MVLGRSRASHWRYGTALLLVGVLLVGVRSESCVGSAGAGEPAVSAWVAVAKPGSNVGEVLRRMRARGADVESSGFASGRLIEFSGSEAVVSEAAEQMRHDPSFSLVEPVMSVRASFVPSDPQYSAQWGLGIAGASAAWDVTRGRPDVVIGVIDTGVDLSHGDLVENVDTDNDYDFVNEDSIAQDDEGHGTHVAGIAAAAANGKFGVGVAPSCRILPVKVLDHEGSGSSVDVARGIEWAVDHGADVINLSLGSSTPSEVIRAAIQYAQAKGVLVVAAAGNDGKYGVDYPAAFPGVLSVGASDAEDVLAAFSNYGPEVDIVAPGVGIVSTQLGGSTTMMSGTSMATPFIAGAAALLKAANPQMTADSIAGRLCTTAEDKGVPGFDIQYGFGRVSLSAALSVPTPPVPAPDLLISAVTGPESAEPGQGIVVSTKVKNIGGSAASPSAVGVYLSSDQEISTADRLLGSRRVPELGSGSESVGSVAATLPEDIAGTYYLGAIADVERSVQESDESNNSLASVAVQVGKTQLTKIDVHLSAENPLQGSGVLLAGCLSEQTTLSPGLASRLVLIQKSRLGTDAWFSEAVVVTDESGRFSWRFSAPDVAHVYRATYRGVVGRHAPSVSGFVVLKPKAELTAPIVPSRVRTRRAYRIVGYMRPRHDPGTFPVRVQLRHFEDGSWRHYRYVAAKVSDYAQFSRYACTIVLPYEGRWSVRALAPEDRGHAATWSGQSFVRAVR